MHFNSGGREHAECSMIKHWAQRSAGTSKIVFRQDLCYSIYSSGSTAIALCTSFTWDDQDCFMRTLIHISLSAEERRAYDIEELLSAY